MHTSENIPMRTPEAERAPAVVELIAPHGLGFGHGSISVKDQIDSGILTPEVPQRVHEYLMKQPAAFKPVECDDDGCGDGRPWSKVEQLLLIDGETKLRIFGESRRRAKVFGGGLVVAASMLRAMSGAPRNEQTVGGDRAFMAEKLQSRGFTHGAHTSDHASGDNCGCGAIDNYQEVTRDALQYREQITNTLEAVYGDTFDQHEEAINQVYAVYESLVRSENFFADASGNQSMRQIKSAGAVVKTLSGNHVEETIVINEVPGTTLDQPLFTQEVKNACTEKPQTVQAFSVDAWRGHDIARITTDIMAEQHPDLNKEMAYKLAVADFWIRTLAVAGTLTSGDLPVYRRRVA